jgi:CDGSH-type Zn-finger protein
MEQPNIFDRQSKSIKLDEGTHYYCRCGKSKDGIFCDGSHEGTSFVPKKFKVDEPTTIYACLCKHTKNAPHCDGSHRSLPTEEA